MESMHWLFGVLVSLAVASCLVLSIAAVAVRVIVEPARRIRIIELAFVGLAVLPLVSLVPEYPRWSPWNWSGGVSAPLSAMPVVHDLAQPESTAAKAAATGNVDPEQAVAIVTHRASQFSDYRVWLVGLYALSAAAMAAWSAAGWAAMRSVLRAARAADSRAYAALREVAGGAGDHVRLIESSKVRHPCAFGWWRPTIVLPLGFTGQVDARRLRWVLAHEWSHVKRGDWRSWTAGNVLGWWYFYQPLYWHLRRQLYVCQDFVADAAAASRGGTAEDYAEFLTHSAADWPPGAMAAGLGLGGRISDLHRRVIMLLGRHAPLESSSPRIWNLAAIGLACVLVATAACLVEGPLHVAAAGEKAGDAKSKAPGKLSYNDDTGESKKSIGGNGEMISFTLPSAGAKVSGIRIHGSRYGLPQPPKEDFMIYFLNGDMTETVATKTAPYSKFKRGEQEWVTIRFPKPIEVPKEFWVCLDFRAERTKGVYLSVDNSTDGAHSRVGLPGMESRAADVGGDWMVEVLLAN